MLLLLEHFVQSTYILKQNKNTKLAYVNMSQLCMEKGYTRSFCSMMSKSQISVVEHSKAENSKKILIAFIA